MCKQLKGQYGRIAKFYGPDATYDAIKSIFANEVSKCADQLKAQSANPPIQEKETDSGKPLSTTRRPLLTNLEDEDINIVHQQRATKNKLPQLESPNKRPRLEEPSRQCFPSTRADPGGDNRPVHTTHPVNHPGVMAAPSQRDPALTAQRSPIPSDQSSTDVLFPSVQRLTLEKTPNQVVTPIRQPPPQQEHRSNVNGPETKCRVGGTTTQESFGYVTNRGEYRCALCFTQLDSQQNLKEHESMSGLHRRNLMNPYLIARAHSKLTEVSAPASERRGKVSINGNNGQGTGRSQPLTLGGFGPRGASAHNIAAVDAVEFDDEGDRGSSPSDAIVAQPGGGLPCSAFPPPRPPKLPPTDVTRRASMPRPVQNNLSGKVERSQEKSKGKRRASPSPSPSTAPSQSTNSRPISIGQVNEILRHTGARLAEKCIESNPDMIAEIIARVRKESAQKKRHGIQHGDTIVID